MTQAQKNAFKARMAKARAAKRKKAKPAKKSSVRIAYIQPFKVRVPKFKKGSKTAGTGRKRAKARSTMTRTTISESKPRQVRDARFW